MNRDYNIHLYLAIVSTIIAFGVQMQLKYTSSTHTAIILGKVCIWKYIFSINSEKLTLKLFVGSLIVLLSVITAETKWDF